MASLDTAMTARPVCLRVTVLTESGIIAGENVVSHGGAQGGGRIGRD
jgi:hypothetical protein